MKRNLITILAFAFLLSSFTSNNKQKDNTLSKQEKKEGWKLLFDGTTTNGWRIYQNKKVDDWDVKNGELYCKVEGVSKRADLITNDKYENFELQIDWKIAPKENGGIIYMVTEDNGATYESGPEYQLIDDEGYPEKIKDVQLSGANYDMNPPTTKVVKPVGEFNHTKIVINKGHVEHWLNGARVLAFELDSDEVKEAVAKSKFKNTPGFPAKIKGHILLTDHRDEASFRNIKIRPLN